MSWTRLGRATIALNEVWTFPVRRTYAVFGLERGGTSAVAGIVRALGIDLGSGLDRNNEDFAFHERSLEEMKQVVAERNATHDVWGFKYPNAGQFLPVLSRSLRNPFYIVVHRDPVATAHSRSRWDGEETERPAMMALFEAGSRDQANVSFALATDRPVLLVSNEKTESHREDLIREVADFLAVPPPSEDLMGRLLAYLEPGSYKAFEEYFPERG